MRVTATVVAALLLTMMPVHAAQKIADARLRAIYTAEWKWREVQLADDQEGTKPVVDHLPKVAPAAQAVRLAYWQRVMKQLDAVPYARLSPRERVNYDVYKPQIANLIADQKFRVYEMPANSDSSFWTDIGYTARRPFRTLADYKNWITQMRDIPRYFREQIEEMRAGEKRGFTPPRETLEGRDASIAAVTQAKPEESLLYTPFKEMLSSVPAAEQASLRAEAVKVIRDEVQPAYAELLKFWDGEYVPGARTTLAAEALPDGKAYYRQQIREYATLDLSPEAIHKTGVDEVAKLHVAMIAVMRETGFKALLSHSE